MPHCIFCDDILNEHGYFKLHRPCQAPLDNVQCQPCNEAERLESQILEAKQNLENLLEWHREVRSRMNHVHDPVTSTLPPEVTSSIFLACIDEAPSYPFKNSTLWRTANIPWILGAVCRQWRQIVWATPELWTLIRILATSLQPERLVYMRERLLRSGQIPLQLQITPTTYDDGFDIQTVLDFLHERNRTWDSLHIKLLNIHSQVQCDPQAFSKLRVLRLHNVSTISITQDIFWRKSVKPKPEVVELRGFSPHGLNIDWKNVKDFVAEGLPIPRFLEVLQKAPKLRRCHLSTKSNFNELEPFPAVASIYTHNKLQELSIEGFDDEKTSDLLDNACFPSLNHLSFDHMHYRLPTNVILSFIRRSSCLLKRLTLLDADLGNSIIPLLRELPSLRHLHLSPRYGYNFSPKELFKVLASSSIPDVINTSNKMALFLPELEVFQYTHNQYQGDSFPWDLVSRLLGPLDDLHHPLRRPLNTVIIHGQLQNGPLGSLPYLDEDSIAGVTSVLKAGYMMYITDPDRAVDILQASVEYRRMAEEVELDVLSSNIPFSEPTVAVGTAHLSDMTSWTEAGSDDGW